MSWDDNVFYHPEKFGLTQVGMLTDPDACYSFNDLVVWQHEDGSLYWATDSGCSCPVPFDDYSSVDKLDKIETNNDLFRFFEGVDAHCSYSEEYIGEERSAPFKADKVQLKAKIAELWRIR